MVWLFRGIMWLCFAIVFLFGFILLGIVIFATIIRLAIDFIKSTFGFKSNKNYQNNNLRENLKHWRAWYKQYSRKFYYNKSYNKKQNNNENEVIIDAEIINDSFLSDNGKQGKEKEF